jgi:outer membrane protein OmpA-like peptidoglycan-associated protein
MSKVLPLCLLLVACSNLDLSAFYKALLNPQVAVRFDYNSSELRRDVKADLDMLVDYAKQDSFGIQKIEIYGHCDSIGSFAYNDSLSLRRAQKVKEYLLTHGVPDSVLIEVKGYGKRQPLNDNLDSAKRADNRRVEIIMHLVPPPVKDIIIDTVTVKTIEPIADTLNIEPLDVSYADVNDVIDLPDVNFYPDRHALLSGSKKTMAMLLKTMLLNPNLRIEIRGHVCCIPKQQVDALDHDTYTEDLSLQRAKVIYTYLVQKGVAAGRMTYRGFGGQYPLVREFNEATKAKNRRVEIKILSK